MPKASLQDETQLKVLRVLDANPETNQRDLARELGISLGKVNYCLKALLDKGFIKVQNFRGSKNKLAYAYLLTPGGVVAKAELTRNFLKCKIEEYESLRREIDSLTKEVISRKQL